MSTNYYRLKAPVTAIRIEPTVYDTSEVSIDVKRDCVGYLNIKDLDIAEFLDCFREYADDENCPMHTDWGGVDVGIVVTNRAQDLDDSTMLISEYSELTTVGDVRKLQGKGKGETEEDNTMTKTQKAEKREMINDAINQLRQVIKPGDTVYTLVMHVSQSGMSRSIRTYIISDGQPFDISWLTALACGNPIANDGGVTIHGYGSGYGMGSDLVHNLSSVLYGKSSSYTLIHKCL